MNELVLRDFGGVIEVTADAQQLKREALAAAKPIARVETPLQQQTAVEALRKLKEIRSGMEATRKAVKAPVLDLGRKIDATASDFMHDVEMQYGRLSGLINHYQRKQLEAQHKEQDKIRGQAVLADELRSKAKSLIDKAYHLSGKEAVKLEREAARLEAEAFNLEMKTEVAVVPVTDKPKGLVVKNKINFQVLDAIVFAQAWPQYWKVSKNGEHDNECLTVDRMRILDELNKEGGGEFHRTRFPEELSSTEDRRLVRPAGLRVYEETKAHLR